MTLNSQSDFKIYKHCSNISACDLKVPGDFVSWNWVPPRSSKAFPICDHHSPAPSPGEVLSSSQGMELPATKTLGYGRWAWGWRSLGRGRGRKRKGEATDISFKNKPRRRWSFKRLHAALEFRATKKEKRSNCWQDGFNELLGRVCGSGFWDL